MSPNITKLLIFLWIFLMGNQGQAEPFVKISTPAKDSFEVGKSMIIKGSASISEKDRLWAFAHIQGTPKGFSYPQGEIEIDPESNRWEISITFGEECDIGRNFCILIVTIAEEHSDKLHEAMAEMAKNGKWNFVKIPPTKLAPQLRKVKKVSH
jgi:hypothetical protein